VTEISDYKGPKRVFSGIQPSGALHLGNYLGAIKKFVTLQDEHECLFCIVDLHAITVWQDPKLLAAQTREIAAAYLASGVDPKKAIVYNQSAVKAHTELAWYFNCVARMGWLQRMTQFKDKAGKNSERMSVGLFDYPVLQAADILAFKATHVPVGEDQKQHLELSALADLAVDTLSPITNLMNRYLSDPEELDRILATSAVQAAEIADPVVSDVRRIIGFTGT